MGQDPAEPLGQGLFDAIKRELRRRHYSLRTERAYVAWARRYLAFHHQRHPRTMGAPELAAFLDALLARKMSKSSHQQALCAVQFVYQHVLKLAPPQVDGLRRPRAEHHLPVVLSRDEARLILAQMSGTTKLMAGLLYGSGLRVLECARLRVKDVDLDAARLLVRDGKGRKDRVTLLPTRPCTPLRAHLRAVKTLFEADLAAGAGFVELPGALSRKYPAAAREWPWQWVFPATRHYRHGPSRRASVRFEPRRVPSSALLDLHR